uniref:recombinase family protein n=1 Tax=Agathobacter sp. TaxID=2021311 RepID=UPI004056B684
MVKRVRTLLRVSSKQQLHEDDIPMQRAETLQYISRQKDWKFDKEYMEKAVSAYKNSVQDRETLQQILKDAKSKVFEVLLVYMSDRIGRQEEYSFYVAALNELGIEIWSVKEGQIKTKEHIDKLVTYIKFWQNEGESKKTSIRVHDTQADMVKSGKFTGGKVPFGYRLVDSGIVSNHGRLLKKPVIVEEQAGIVQKIYTFAIHQGYGYQKIANELNKQGIPAPTLPIWKSGTIADILKNPMYMGYYAMNRRKTPYNHTRQDRKDWIYSENPIPELVIISEQDWKKAQEIRESRRDRLRAAKEQSFQAYENRYGIPFSVGGKLALTGIVYCGYCGKRLKNGSYINHWETKDGQRKISYAGRYLCPQKCKERTSYAQDYLEQIVFELVENYLETVKHVDMAEELQTICKEQDAGRERKLQSIRKEIKKLQEDIQTLEDKIPEAIRGDYYFSAEKLAELVREKEQKLEYFTTQERELETIAVQNLKRNKELETFILAKPNWKEEFANADTAEKKMLLFSFIDRIEAKDGEICVKMKVRTAK